MDYQKLSGIVDGKLSRMTKIEIADLLSLEDYYTTDTHWKQESITDVADRILEKMDNHIYAAYEQQSAGDFYGVYYGQSALDIDPDELIYLTNGTIKNCEVYNYENSGKGEVYDMNQLDSMDLYGVFLSGPVSLLEITNPEQSNGRELVVFRDSFGSSLSPLLIAGYEKITLVDIRYIMPQTLSKYIEFNNQDVLFIYSTMIINSSSTLK